MTTNLTAIGLRAIAQALQVADATPGDAEGMTMVPPDPMAPPAAGAPPPDGALAAQIAMTGAPVANALG